MDVAGMDVTSKLKRGLMEQGIHISTGDARILKERFAYVNPIAPAAPVPSLKRRASAVKTAAASTGETMSIILPDGNEVTVERSLFGECTESLMINKDMLYGGLSKSVYESLVLCDDSVLGELKSNIIISGGSSMLAGLGDRLTNDLNAMFSSRTVNIDEKEAAMRATEIPIRVMPSSFYKESGYTNQRKHAAWQGGSIFSSFESFKQLRVTRQEFEEGAEASLLAKCL
jgi:actin